MIQRWGKVCGRGFAHRSWQERFVESGRKWKKIIPKAIGLFNGIAKRHFSKSEVFWFESK